MNTENLLIIFYALILALSIVGLGYIVKKYIDDPVDLLILFLSLVGYGVSIILCAESIGLI